MALDYHRECDVQATAPVAAESLRAVIFDVDGTLAETERDGHRVAFNQAFARFGLDWNWSVDAYGELLAVTGGKERIGQFAARHAPALLNQAGGETWLASLHQLKSEIYAQLVAAGTIRLRPGVARLLRELRGAGVRLAIATTTTPSSLQCLLAANLGDASPGWFEVIGAGDIVAHKKPAPDIYRWVLDKLQLPAAACLAVEDSVPGLAAAQAAGLPVLITRNAYSGAADFAGALCVVSDLGEPGAPAQRLAGLALAGECVDLAQLRCWHRQAANSEFQIIQPRPANCPPQAQTNT